MSGMSGFSQTNQLAPQTGLTGTVTNFSQTLSVEPVGIFNAIKPSLLDTQGSVAQATARGAILVALDELPQYQDDTTQVAWMNHRPIAVSTNAPSFYNSLSGTSWSAVKTSAGRVYSARATSFSGSACFFQFSNAIALPAVGTAVVSTTLVSGSGSIFLDYRPHGMYFSTGITWTASEPNTTTPSDGSKVRVPVVSSPGLLVEIEYM
jgi:hypothetical protein